MQKESLIEDFEEKSKVSVIDILKIIFNENISLEQRISIMKQIDEEIAKILLEFEKESEPIDE